MEAYEPQDSFLIRDLETLRTVSDPLRTQIYEILIQGPANVRQLGDRLGLAPSRLYYHVNLLEKFGLLRVVETRMVGNVLEKYYRAISYSLHVDPNLLNFSTDEGKAAIEEMLIAGLDTTRDDLLRSFRARLFVLEQGSTPKERSMMVSRTTARITDAYAEEFRARLQALIEEFGEKDLGDPQPGEQRENFALMVVFYPSFYYPEEKQT